MRRGSVKLGFEVKLTSSPRVTPSMRSAKENLGLDEVIVVFAGDEVFPLTQGIRAVGFSRLRTEIPPLD